VRVEDVVEGGWLSRAEVPAQQGVVVSHQTRLGRVGYWRADHERAPGSALSLADVGHDEDDKVQCIVLLRKNQDTLPAYFIAQAVWIVVSHFPAVPACSGATRRGGEGNLAWVG
jgi:hypothetical protein